MEAQFSDKTYFHWNQIQSLKKQLGYDIKGNIPEKVDVLNDIIDSVKILPNQYFYINHTPTSHTVYVSPEVMDILGYEREEFEYRRQMDIIHPEDQPIVMAGMKYYYPLTNFKVFKPFELGVHFNYRAYHKNGTMKKLLRYASPIIYDESGKMVYHISMATDITEMQPSNRVHIWHTGLPDDVPQFPTDKFYNNSLLSKREIDVLFYLCEGLNSIGIAEKLFISRHTVDTHRRKILAKMEVENTGQLIRKALELEVIPQSPVTSRSRNGVGSESLLQHDSKSRN
jgi:PAS domain S-box-containing protein